MLSSLLGRKLVHTNYYRETGGLLESERTYSSRVQISERKRGEPLLDKFCMKFLFYTNARGLATIPKQPSGNFVKCCQYVNFALRLPVAGIEW